MRVIPLSTVSDLPITWHNVEEIDDGRRGLTLQRMPREWRDRFPTQTAFRATQAAGVEIRFRAATRYLALDLSMVNHTAYRAAIALYHGYRAVGLVSLSATKHDGRVVLLDREADIDGVLDVPWRIICPYGARTIVKALHLSDGAEVFPASRRPVRWLAHGDSITQGAHAMSPAMTYVNLAADALGWDAINMGFGGSAWGDAVVAEYIASRQDWDVLSIAIGTNTYGGSKEPASDLKRRYDEFLSIIRDSHPGKPILCVTPVWRKQDVPPEEANVCGDTPRAYRRAIEDVVRGRQAEDARLALLDGLELIGGPRGLGVDLVHPDDHGMLMMAQGIAEALGAMSLPLARSPRAIAPVALDSGV